MWEKLGQLFCANGEAPWMRTHASCPVAEFLEGDRFRVYFSTRDEKQHSSIAWVEIDLREPAKVVRVCERPVLMPGAVGLFDDAGASMGCLVEEGGRTLLYYLGWNTGGSVPWRNSIGLAARDGGSSDFTRVSLAPVLDRNHFDPYSLSYPWVMKEGATWKMWYGSNLSWGAEKHSMAHVLKYAESTDGRHWQPSGDVCVEFKNKQEYAISKPCVRRGPRGYEMWYSFRGEAYRLGYAVSQDGRKWTRRDEEVGIAVSDSGWDSETICYPFVFEHRGQRYLLYNGNRYGATGFGLARWRG